MHWQQLVSAFLCTSIQLQQYDPPREFHAYMLTRFWAPHRYIQAPPARGMFVSRPNEAPREVELISGRPHVTKGNTVWLLRFKQIKDRDDAETLRNYKCASASTLMCCRSRHCASSTRTSVCCSSVAGLHMSSFSNACSFKMSFNRKDTIGRISAAKIVEGPPDSIHWGAFGDKFECRCFT